MTTPILPKNYYMITNRASKNGKYIDAIAPQGALTFFTAPAASTTNFTMVDQSDWLAALQADLQANGSGAVARANLFVHGYGVSFTDATTVFPTYFSNLQDQPNGAGYPGVQIGFDWPSNDVSVFESSAFKHAKELAQLTGSESFPLLAQLMTSIKQTGSVASVSLTAICHSMGNYAMYEGAGAFAPPSGAAPPFDQILCVAAMLENSGFSDSSSQTYCADIIAAGSQVTIYYSNNDDVLPIAQGKGFDDYPELGYGGPSSYQTMLPGAIGLDCTQVVTVQNAKTYDPSHMTHTSYFFIPEVLQDLATTLLGGQGGYPDRTPMSGTPNGFDMVPD